MPQWCVQSLDNKRGKNSAVKLHTKYNVESDQNEVNAGSSHRRFYR